MNALNPDQFLYHGTAMEVEGKHLLPAKEHGKGSYWGDAGKTRGQPANESAWAHPDEQQAWHFAHDRVIHTAVENEWNPRARVYAVHQNTQQEPGNDFSIPGEVKAPYFDVAHRIDTMPGRQGTIPDINWNNHTQHTGLFSDDEDANHPKNLSVQFGHRYGHMGDHWNGPMRDEARKEDLNRSLDRSDALGTSLRIDPAKNQMMLPGMSSDDRKYMRPRGVVYPNG